MGVAGTGSQLAKREAAIWLTEDDPEYLSLDHAEMLKPEDFVEFKRDGLVVLTSMGFMSLFRLK